MSVAVRVKPALALLAMGAAAVVGGFLLGRAMPCGFNQCNTVESGGSVDALLRNGQQNGRPLVVRGRALRAVTPGARVPIDLSVSNPNEFAVRAGQLAVEVQTVRAPRSSRTLSCSSEDFTVTQASAALEVSLPAQRSTTLSAERVSRRDWPVLEMLDTRSNQDGCKGAVVRLHYTAYTTQAHR